MSCSFRVFSIISIFYFWQNNKNKRFSWFDLLKINQNNCIDQFLYSIKWAFRRHACRRLAQLESKPESALCCTVYAVGRTDNRFYTHLSFEWWQCVSRLFLLFILPRIPPAFFPPRPRPTDSNHSDNQIYVCSFSRPIKTKCQFDISGRYSLHTYTFLNYTYLLLPIMQL